MSTTTSRSEIRRQLTTIREDRAGVLEKAKALSERAARESRDLRPDEFKQYQKYEAELDRLGEKITELSDDAIFGDGSSMTRSVFGRRDLVGFTDDERHNDASPAASAALRTIDGYLKRDVLRPKAADRLDSLVRKHDPKGTAARYIDAVGSPDYFRAFGKLVADPMTGHLRFSNEEVEAVRRVSEAQEARAMGTGTGGAGGFAIPFMLDPSILLSSDGALNPIRQLARLVTIESHDWHGITSAGVTAAYVPEATEATDASPTLVQPTIKTAQGRAFIPFSIELGADWPGAAEELLRLVRDGRDVLDATKFLIGSGTDEPAGVITGLTTTQRVQTATTATYAVGDPWLLKAAISPRFIPNTTFAANPAAWDTTYRFVAQGSTAEPRQFANGDRGGDFLGHPKVEVSTMATGSTTSTKLIVGGDFYAGYTIVDRIGMSAELIPHLFGAANRYPTGQRGLYAYWRTGAAVVVPNAFRYLEVK